MIQLKNLAYLCDLKSTLCARCRYCKVSQKRYESEWYHLARNQNIYIRDVSLRDPVTVDRVKFRRSFWWNDSGYGDTATTVKDICSAILNDINMFEPDEDELKDININISDKKITSLEGLPVTLDRLYISRNKIKLTLILVN
jgi:hypothetical protein